MKKFSSFKRQTSDKKLRFEVLENRELLAVAALELPVDSLDLTSTTISSEIVASDSFVVELPDLSQEVQSEEEDPGILIASWEVRYADESQNLWDDDSSEDSFDSSDDS